MRVEISARAIELADQLDAIMEEDHKKMNGWKNVTVEQLIAFWHERGEVYKKLNDELKKEVYGRMPQHLREAYEFDHQLKRQEAYRRRKAA